MQSSVIVKCAPVTSALLISMLGEVQSLYFCIYSLFNQVATNASQSSKYSQ